MNNQHLKADEILLIKNAEIRELKMQVEQLEFAWAQLEKTASHRTEETWETARQFNTEGDKLQEAKAIGRHAAWGYVQKIAQGTPSFKAKGNPP